MNPAQIFNCHMLFFLTREACHTVMFFAKKHHQITPGKRLNTHPDHNIYQHNFLNMTTIETFKESAQYSIIHHSKNIYPFYTPVHYLDDLGMAFMKKYARKEDLTADEIFEATCRKIIPACPNGMKPMSVARKVRRELAQD